MILFLPAANPVGWTGTGLTVCFDRFPGPEGISRKKEFAQYFLIKNCYFLRSHLMLEKWNWIVIYKEFKVASKSHPFRETLVQNIERIILFIF